ncbi:MAG: co-chaperone GroES [Peptoniphilaceae bacterium]|nr:co-chaperone GroES [Peptoniphilaceae bacterium]MCI6659817.1 co-chaperone GroES [Peptoniphilaceae bacterium]MDD7433878.1 co-chaperone GroES [Peptoniphilaceae bacterium]MDD7542859.1 co-chaperone GroES [Peptoniphilaceae bacterium]MDY3075187.1 co-chaperone GroES [Peptoniphilaceae bacterium]
MKLNPIGERIVIRKLEKEETTASGIVLPSSAQEQPQYAEVTAISDQIHNNDDYKNSVQIGDHVIYSKYAGTEVKLDGEEYIVIKLEDVLAVVED